MSRNDRFTYIHAVFTKTRGEYQLKLSTVTDGLVTETWRSKTLSDQMNCWAPSRVTELNQLSAHQAAVDQALGPEPDILIDDIKKADIATQVRDRFIEAASRTPVIMAASDYQAWQTWARRHALVPAGDPSTALRILVFPERFPTLPIQRHRDSLPIIYAPDGSLQYRLTSWEEWAWVAIQLLKRKEVRDQIGDPHSTGATFTGDAWTTLPALTTYLLGEAHLCPLIPVADPHPESVYVPAGSRVRISADHPIPGQVNLPKWLADHNTRVVDSDTASMTLCGPIPTGHTKAGMVSISPARPGPVTGHQQRWPNQPHPDAGGGSGLLDPDTVDRLMRTARTEHNQPLHHDGRIRVYNKPRPAHSKDPVMFAPWRMPMAIALIIAGLAGFTVSLAAESGLAASLSTALTVVGAAFWGCHVATSLDSEIRFAPGATLMTTTSRSNALGHVIAKGGYLGDVFARTITPTPLNNYPYLK